MRRKYKVAFKSNKKVEYAVSFSDLARHPNYPRYTEVQGTHLEYVQQAPTGLGLIVKALPDVKSLEPLLEDFGLDTRKEYEYEVVAHKNFSDELVICGRWSGYERRDKKWQDIKARLKN